LSFDQQFDDGPVGRRRRIADDQAAVRAIVNGERRVLQITDRVDMANDGRQSSADELARP
jgi:hypothetical protein